MDGVTMVFPLEPIQTNIFHCPHEEKRLNEFPVGFKWNVYGRFLDDIFVLIPSTESANSFQIYISSKH